MQIRLKQIIAIVLVALSQHYFSYAQTYDKEWPEKEGFIRVMKVTDFNGTKIPLYGFLNKDRSVFIPCIYDYAGDFTCGLAVVATMSMPVYEKDEINLWLQPKYSYIDAKGNNLNYSFDFATDVNKENKSILVGVPFLPYMKDPSTYKCTKYQFLEIPLTELISNIGHQDKLNIPLPYKYWADYQDNAEKYCMKYDINFPIKGYYNQYFNFTTNEISNTNVNHGEVEFVKGTIFDEFVIVFQHGLCGIKSNKSNNFLIPCMCEDVKPLGMEKIAVKRGKWAILDKSGNFLTGYIFDKINGVFNESERFAMVSKVDYRLDYGSSWRYVFKTYSLTEQNLNSVIQTYFTSK